MRRVLTSALAALAATATAAHAEPSIRDRLLTAVGDEVVHVEAYRVHGIDLRRGYHLDTRPRLNLHGHCRSQRLTFFQRRNFDDPIRDAALKLDRLEIVNRYRQPNWLGDSKTPDCTVFARSGWVIADSDWAYDLALPVLKQTAQIAARGDYGAVRLTCQEYNVPCADPPARLKEAFGLGIERVELTTGRRTVTASHTPYAGRQYVMVLTLGASGALERIDLNFPVPPLS